MTNWLILIVFPSSAAFLMNSFFKSATSTKYNKNRHLLRHSCNYVIDRFSASGRPIGETELFNRKLFDTIVHSNKNCKLANSGSEICSIARPFFLSVSVLRPLNESNRSVAATTISSSFAFYHKSVFLFILHATAMTMIYGWFIRVVGILKLKYSEETISSHT